MIEAADVLIEEEIAQGHGLSLAQAARRFPSSRQGKPVTLSCLFRWVVYGVRILTGEKVRLEAARVAGRWITTPQAIARFIRSQTPSQDGQVETRSPTARRRASDRAARRLEEAGI